MQKLVVSLLILFTTALSAQDCQKYAVIVGCSDYQTDGMDLRYSDDDAYRMFAYLKSVEGGSLPDDHISVLVDEAATKANILNTMNEVFARADEDDLLIFYFSGHGSEDAFCPIDLSNQYSSLLQHSEIKAVFRKYPARYKICLADACFSGSIYQGRPDNSSSASSSTETSVVIMMSSRQSETSQENPKIRQGAFTYYLLKGLKGSADRNSDRTITLEELFPYVKANVLNLTGNRQTPFIEGNAPRTMPIGVLR
jgi:uncharacterized caspase-like protein